MKPINLTSSVFEQGAMIPKQYSCDGEDISPELSWSNIPEGTKSLVLICDDPDAPMGTFDHWILFNIPSSYDGLPENYKLTNKADEKIKGGTNHFNKLDYGGPCPPDGLHRYFFKLYALDMEVLPLQEGASKEEVEKTMEGHILGKGELMGKYDR